MSEEDKSANQARNILFGLAGCGCAVLLFMIVGSLVIIGAVTALGNDLEDTFQNISDEVNTAP